MASTPPSLIARLRALQGNTLAVSAALLALVFAVETLVMAGIEAWLPIEHSGWREALLDATVLTLVSAPFIVWVVRRFRRRSHLALRALDIASDGFWVVDAQGRLLDVNAGYERMSGYTRAELLGMRINDLDALETPADTKERIDRIMAAGFARFDSRHRRRDGSEFDVHITTAWLADLRRFAAFVHDDSARVAAERAVAAQARQLQHLLDSTAEGIYGIDLQGRCTFINRAALRMLGYAGQGDETALLGHDMHVAMHHHHADGRPYPAADCPIYQAFRAARPVHRDDEVFWRRDGSHFAVECWSNPVVEDGVVRGAIATFFDISERQSEHAQLEDSNRRLEQTFELAPVGMAHVSLDGRMLRANRALGTLLGRAPAALVGLSYRDVTPPEEWAATDALLESAQHDAAAPGSSQPHTLEKRYLRPDGSEVWGLLSTALVPAAGDHAAYRVSVIKDITERKRFEAEREALNAIKVAHQARTEFLSRMSHELRTPLNAVLGFAQLLRDDAGGPLSEAQRRHTERIHQAGEHLLALVNDLLDLSLIEAGRMQLSLEPVNLAAVADESFAMLKGLAGEHQVTLRLADGEADDDAARVIDGQDAAAAPWVQADRVRLRQVLLNLLSNAIKYNRTGGTVTLHWQRDGTQCRLQIADTGPGIPALQRAHLFEPFNRLGAEHSHIEGTGIGLVVARRLAELMRGELTVDSRVGEGTVVTLTLRCAERPTAVAAPGLPASPHPRATPRPGVKVLYVEDNEVNVELVRAVVRLRPNVVLQVATQGSEALALARAEPPDLMLLDMHLGDMTGLELARALRADPATAAIPLAALSADALPAQIDAALAQGFAAYLTKPIDFAALLRLLDDAAGA